MLFRSVPMDDPGLVERKRLMYNGHVVVSLVADQKGHLLASPGIVVQGLPQGDTIDTPEVLSEAAEAAYESLKLKQRRDPDVAKEETRIAVRRACRDLFGKRPVVTVQLTTI